MFKILDLLVRFVYEAMVTHAASEQGGAELVEILDAVEAEGIDIPFYEPSGQEGETGNVGDVGSNDPSVSSFQSRHPELYKE